MLRHTIYELGYIVILEHVNAYLDWRNRKFIPIKHTLIKKYEYKKLQNYLAKTLDILLAHFLLLCQNTMTMATHRGKSLWGFMVPEGEYKMGGKTWQEHPQSWRLRDHIFNYKHTAKKERTGKGLTESMNSQRSPQWQLSLSRLCLSFLTAPQGGLSVQIQKTMEDIFKSNEYRLLSLFSLKVWCCQESFCVQISLLLTSYETQSRK